MQTIQNRIANYSPTPSGVQRGEMLTANKVNEIIRSGSNGVSPPSQPYQYDDEYLWSFGLDWEATGKVTIYAGRVHIHGDYEIEVDETELTLSASTDYVYVQWERGQSIATVEHSASYPTSNNTYVRQPLAKFEKVTVDETDYWNPTKRYHRGDVDVANAIRYGS